MQPIRPEAQKVLKSLEPENVIGYTVSEGHAFDGVTLKGFFGTFDEAHDYVESTGFQLEDWHIVPLWRPE